MSERIPINPEPTPPVAPLPRDAELVPRVDMRADDDLGWFVSPPWKPGSEGTSLDTGVTQAEPVSEWGGDWPELPADYDDNIWDEEIPGVHTESRIPEREIEPQRLSKFGSFALKISAGLTKLKEWPISHHTPKAAPEQTPSAGKLTGTLLAKQSRLRGTLLDRQTALNNASGVELKAALAESTAESAQPVEITTEAEEPLDVVAYETEVDMDTVVDMLEQGRVVKRAPTLMEVATDPDREGQILQVASPRNLTTHGLRDYETMDTYELSESESVAGLMDFLTEVAERAPEYANRARDMLENLTYIGEKERTEAMMGIAAHWKAWLRESPDRQICALASISDEGENKSDRYLLDGILDNFSDEELAEFEHQLIMDIADLTSAPEDARIILLDDWTISGSQMTGAFGKISSEAGKYLKSIEIQLVTSTEHRIRHGKSASYQGDQHIIPVRSYFLSHKAEVRTEYAGEGHDAYETGSHSSVDYDFQNMISNMRYRLDMGPQERNMPPTTNIPRIYKKMHLRNIDRLQARRKSVELVGAEV